MGLWEMRRGFLVKVWLKFGSELFALYICYQNKNIA
jgi:hypothetical protein